MKKYEQSRVEGDCCQCMDAQSLLTFLASQKASLISTWNVHVGSAHRPGPCIVVYCGSALGDHEWGDAGCLVLCSDTRPKQERGSKRRGGDCCCAGGVRRCTPCFSGSLHRPSCVPHASLMLRRGPTAAKGQNTDPFVSRSWCACWRGGARCVSRREKKVGKLEVQ